MSTIETTTEDSRKKQYIENKKVATAKKKEARDKLIEEGKSTELRMSFFTTILQSLKIPYTELAKKSGYSQQLISWWIHTDDCKLSNIIKILESVNVKITPSFSPKNNSTVLFSASNFRIEAEDISAFIKLDEKGKVLQNSIDHNGNLAFLARFIKEQKMPLQQFSNIVELNYNLVYRWFEHDDIMISKLYQIADKLDQTIVWKIEPIKKNES